MENEMLKQILSELKQLKEGQVRSENELDQLRAGQNRFEKELGKLGTRFDSELLDTRTQLESRFDTQFSQMETRFESQLSDTRMQLETRFESELSSTRTQMNTRFDGLGTGVDRVKRDVAHIKNKLDRLASDVPQDIMGLLTQIHLKISKRDSDVQALNKRLFHAESRLEQVAGEEFYGRFED